MKLKEVLTAFQVYFENPYLRILFGVGFLVAGYMAFVVGLSLLSLPLFIFGLVFLAGLKKGFLEGEKND